jgi:hypothetical protein
MDNHKSRNSVTLGILGASLTGLSTTFALAGPDWIEDGDAGSSLDLSQDTTKVGVVQSIAGTLGGEDREDVYRLVIEDGDDIANPTDVGFTFSGELDFDPALWLFDSAGFGVLGNDDDPILGGPGARLITPSTDGVTLLLVPGIYFIAITESGNVPLSFNVGAGLGEGTFEEIFSFEDQFEVSGPDGLGAGNPLAGWSGGKGSSGSYGVVITPTPSTLAMCAVIGLGGLRRRRS